MSWQDKAHRRIAELCHAEWRNANPRGRNRHRPYSVPMEARELVRCLGDNDEVGAKAIFVHGFCPFTSSAP